MQIIPAIDLKEGKVVRLTGGDYEKVTAYSEDPRGIAKRWESEGAGALHVVDLDGALAGHPQNTDKVKEIVEAVKIPVELGGGLRSLNSISYAFDAGVARAVLGSKAVDDIDFIKTAIKRMEEEGASAVIYTDIAVDGTLSGPNFKRLDNFLGNINIPVIVAGGFSSLDDIRKLYALNRKNLSGVIIGKALYEGTIDLREAIGICSRKE